MTQSTRYVQSSVAVDVFVAISFEQQVCIESVIQHCGLTKRGMIVILMVVGDLSKYLADLFVGVEL